MIGFDKAVDHYRRRGHLHVDGWLSTLDATLVALIGTHQNRQGIDGSVGEIGVHRGRLFILLALLLQGRQRGFAIDIFEDQHLNVDRSGQGGSEAAFRQFLTHYSIAVERVDSFRRSSLEIAWPEILRKVGQPARLFSVDGGHTAAITVNDLGIADAGLAEQGVIILDDYFNPEFPEVSEGLCRALLGGLRLVPFAIGDNKLLLSRPDVAAGYRDFLAAEIPRRFFVKETSMFGGDVLVMRTPRTLATRVRQTEIVRRLRDTPLGIKLQPLVRRILQGR